jgi:propanol-preferring alcohol dehydrogenase
MLLESIGGPLVERERPEPVVGPHDLLLEVLACGICRTDLHILDGDLTEASLPLVPGHQIVGRVLACGDRVRSFEPGVRVGVPWLGGSCGRCRYCESERENLCDDARYTGYQRDGGFAERCAADARYCFPLPEDTSDEQAAPLLCAGLIGYRALRMTGDAQRIGFYGFGASAHILAQIARHQGRDVYAFTRPGDEMAQRFARELGAVWSGSAEASAPVPLDAAIVFAPVGALVPTALAAVCKGGVVVCAGIHMSDIPTFPYRLLWGERQLRSVANLTRRDGVEFFEVAARVPVRTRVKTYAFDAANRALDDLRSGRFNGAAVLTRKAAAPSSESEDSRGN